MKSLGRRERFRDIGILVALAICAALLTFLLRPNFLTTTILFFGLPVVYLAIRAGNQVPWGRVLTMTGLFGILYGFILEFIAERSHAWQVGAGTHFLTPQILLSTVSPDVVVWFILWVLYIVLFYERFLDHDRSSRISNNMEYALVPGLLTLAVVALVYFFAPWLLSWRYGYAILCILTLPPVGFLWATHPRLIPKLLTPAAFFAPLYLMYELVALPAGQWVFNGQYIGMVHLVVGVEFPIEEFVFWIGLSSVIIVSYYELYVDDMR